MPTAAMTSPWLLVSATFAKTGGQDRANFALAAYLAACGAELHIVAHRYGGVAASGSRVIHHRASRLFGSDFLGEPVLRWHGARWARRLAARGAQVVVNGGNCPWPGVNWVHYVHAAHDRSGEGGGLRGVRWSLMHRQWLRDERSALERARLIIANSERTASDLVERVGVPADRIRVVYYGIDADRFQPATADERTTLRQSFGWNSDRPVALFIGALGDRRKGLDTTLRAWREMRRSAATLPLLVVIGQGALLSELRSNVHQLGLADDVRFLGFRTDVAQLLRAADLLIAPTRYEAYGLGVHEALCCGLPAIVSAHAGVAERYPPVLREWLLPDPENATDLARLIQAALSRIDATASQLAAFSACLRARTWDDMARDIVAASVNAS